MGDLLTVAQLCDKLDKRPQEINMWVRKMGLAVAQEKPRMLDWDVVQAFLGQKTTRTHERKEVSQKRKADKAAGIVEPEDLSAPMNLLLSESQRKILAWSRGAGRGWALAAFTKECQPLDDYAELMTHDGKNNITTGTRLRQELAEGKLFFFEPVDALVFVLQQLTPLLVEERASDAEYPALDEGCSQLEAAIKTLRVWKEQRNGQSIRK